MPQPRGLPWQNLRWHFRQGCENIGIPTAVRKCTSHPKIRRELPFCEVRLDCKNKVWRCSFPIYRAPAEASMRLEAAFDFPTRVNERSYAMLFLLWSRSNSKDLSMIYEGAVITSLCWHNHHAVFVFCETTAVRYFSRSCCKHVWGVTVLLKAMVTILLQSVC